MAQTIPVNKITLYDLEQRFQLAQDRTSEFFDEWQTALLPLTEAEKQRLDRVQLSVANLERRSLLENTVKLAVLAPLLDLAGLFLAPFYVSTEDAVNIEATDNSLVIQGRIDILVLKEELWILVIESKRAEFSPKVGIPQALSYMLAAPKRNSPIYGLVTNGTDFVFLKLVFEEVPRYGRSRQFVLGQDHDLEQVLQVLKHLARILSK
ncbi:type I restriction endonuclease [Leptothoe sp. PORK10 BA2]|uniref:type I restriction endonuclease n=1 Tax=Leptothoe sp. PORK10 BA2 TaxID=3110254 RepID=UPI002B2080B8|nr:restriction endonuclease subunit R [Leptothoe sp. PORK10 BA2]MEA5466848.1 restriction endonuclease subunit R [Leptothoe sp. PORK10 BA2]